MKKKIIAHVTLHRFDGRGILRTKYLCRAKGRTWPKKNGFQPTCKNCLKKVA